MLEPGRILKVYCPNKLVWHYGIWYGQNQVIDLAPRNGVAIRSLQEFSEGQDINILPLEEDDYPPRVILNNALQYVGRLKYDILDWNCEQFVNICRKGKKFSKQLRNVGIGVATLTLVSIILFSLSSRRKN